jgi:fumarate hydratase subunit beta
MDRTLHFPLAPADYEILRQLRAGQSVSVNGTILVARDQAHLRLASLLHENAALPVALEGQAVYYMGPAPVPPGQVMGSCGPTTATRMDPFTPALLDRGLKAMIGKGQRSRAVVEAMKRNGAVYFYAFGGCGALYASCVLESVVLAFPDLGPEAILALKVKDFPVMVGIDTQGNSAFVEP